jgi:hypothetical protein
VNINAITYYGIIFVIIFVIKKHYSTDDLEMKPPLITNMMQRKDISKYIYKYFIEKDEKDNFVKGIVKWEHKLDTELDGSMLFNGIKMEQFLARSFHLKKYLKLFLLGIVQKLLNLKLMKARY